ncbi:hypothetical protein ACFL60_01260 [Candidatus Omnitrophota bacterium]
MLKTVCLAMTISIAMAVQSAEAQDIREYVVKKTESALEIDGLLSELEWEAAEFTETFIKYTDGSVQQYLTQAKMLWDDRYFYIAFTCEDIDV